MNTLARFCLFFLPIFLHTLIALHADTVRCPVCGQEFDDSVVECPNDGTNLATEGRKVIHAERPLPRDTDDVPATDADTPDDGARYKRPEDSGTRRRPTAVADDDDPLPAERSDRKRRLGSERRPGDTRNEEQRQRAARERQEREQFTAANEAIWREYAQAQEAWQNTQRLAAEEAETERRREAEKQWNALWRRGAPLTSLGARLWWMKEGNSPGPTYGAELGANILRDRIRLGLSSFLGTRALTTRHEFVFFESLNVGLQYPWRFAPWVVARMGIGATVAHRFGNHTPYLLRGFGVEAGIDFRIHPHFVRPPSLGFMHFGIQDANWNTAAFQLAIGF